ncbi:hypothetical protein OE88DRAFT_1811622 [Heliocybe sulcata]|uniref:Sec24-like protein n=1 Tax=Heliocybe sulcata TaxID=5364 RepID=A0A5C3MPU3_9AGAM|nr:hypothetical protein OE88DRAFT_1811622 [Heliocybe sulcata]
MYAHSARIPQPPHSAGQPFKGLRTSIDPSQIPSPIESIEADQEKWETERYLTLPGNHVPLSTTEYGAIDQGNSSPKFIRVSTWNVPSTSSLASQCEIPLAAIIQPFAELNYNGGEEAVPVVDSGSLGPARCGGCRGYVNPWCQWVSGGTRWKCNLCSHETPVESEYFSNLDANGLRLDHLNRPELTKGTVDFIVPEEYWARNPPMRLVPSYHSIEPQSAPGSTREPHPMKTVFAFDVSADAVQSGFLESACRITKMALYEEPGRISGPVAIVTFNTALHFYNLSPNLDQGHMLVVPDLDEVFLPIREGIFVDATESRQVIENLLDALPLRFAADLMEASCLGSAIRGCLAALAGSGGQVILFQAMLPTVGAGALQPRLDESTMYDTDKEKTLFIPRDPAWTDIGVECVEEGVGVNMFLGMHKFIDVGSIGMVAAMTGGQMFFHPRYDAARDEVTMKSEVCRVLARQTAYSCTMRVRCSNGLRISNHYGNFNQRTPTELDFGVLDADQAVSVEFDHTSKLDDRGYAFLQCAVLHTTRDGERRVRTINLALQVASLAGTVFRYADMDAVVAHYAREAVSQLPSRKLAHIREALSEKCASLLLGYRRNCAASSAPSQLILPEAFKTLPVYTLSLLKSKSLKARNVTSDVRNYHARRILSLGVRSLMHHLYPRMLALHDLDDTTALPDANGRISWPSHMRDSYVYMEAHGIYVIDNEEVVVLWVGQGVAPQLLTDLFAVDDIMNLDPHLTALPVLDSRLSVQVRNILTHRQVQRGYTPKMLIARQNIDASEIEFADMLVEDQNNAAMSYLDYLCMVHKQINAALTNGGSISGPSSFRGSPW